jgi:hypothetical protein
MWFGTAMRYSRILPALFIISYKGKGVRIMAKLQQIKRKIGEPAFFICIPIDIIRKYRWKAGDNIRLIENPGRIIILQKVKA